MCSESLRKTTVTITLQMIEFCYLCFIQRPGFLGLYDGLCFDILHNGGLLALPLLELPFPFRRDVLHKPHFKSTLCLYGERPSWSVYLMWGRVSNWREVTNNSQHTVKSTCSFNMSIWNGGITFWTAFYSKIELMCWGFKIKVMRIQIPSHWLTC